MSNIGRKRPAIVSIIELPRCFAGPPGVRLSGRPASRRGKDERHARDVFLINKLHH
ncbi:hypothetical protein [Aneurinibacillus tyrosinisolvens]|uniref:hypothetical protein n=1 Tax=Aneurinibacillus tyrosinisolvens TaxID=1443435 RepID=UPI0013791608|nr:hypothetical protein [Aneurinibacillus tyrosinisolvens]